MSDTDVKCPECKVKVDKVICNRYSCPKCGKSIRWTEEWGVMMADQIAYKEWTGPSKGLMKLFETSASGKLEPEVCSGNLYRLAGMARHEVKMLGMLLDDLREALGKFNGHVYKDDIKDFEGQVAEWRRLFRMAAKRAGHIPEVAALVEV